MRDTSESCLPSCWFRHHALLLQAVDIVHTNYRVVIDTAVDTVHILARFNVGPVLLFSNLNEIFLGNFDPDKVFPDSKNNYFLG